VSFFPRIVAAAGAAVVLPAAALGQLVGPDLRVEGQSVEKGVALTLVLTPSFDTPKPGVTVTMTNCRPGRGAPIRLLRRLRPLGFGQTLKAQRGKIVWTVQTVPARPAKAKLRLMLVKPNGQSRLCVRTSMDDRSTNSTVNLTNDIPL
jgi:hypothetical protein